MTLSCDPRLAPIFARIDAENAGDPVLEQNDAGTSVPRAVLYGQRMSVRLDLFIPEAPFTLQVACRAQHLGRWRVPRSEYPEGRDGYRTWRTDLARRHAEWTGAILTDLGIDATTIERVQALLTKHKFKVDALGQALEDVACLVFLEYYFAAFAREHAPDKIIDIVAKTWKKMSAQGHTAALALPLGPHEATLVQRALAAPTKGGMPS